MLTQCKVNDIPQDLRVILYGAGEFGSIVLNEISRTRPDISVICFADGMKTGRFCEHDIINITQHRVDSNIAFLICSSHFETIADTLKQHGYTNIYAMDSMHYLPPRDIDTNNIDIIKTVQPFTMIGANRILAQLEAVSYIEQYNIPGDIVECGVWAGGSMMSLALKLKQLGNETRSLYLYDTYEGMTVPTEHDVDLAGRKAVDIFNTQQNNGVTANWCCADINTVQQNMLSTGYQPEKFVFSKGDVLQTIPQTVPQQISLLRLDTDWYESTYHELTHLYPLLVKHGILILDDYNFWAGSRKAVDQYFKENNIQMFLQRIDSSGAIGIKLTD